MASQIFKRPVTQEQINAATERRAEQLNENIRQAMDFILTDLMIRVGELESKSEGNEKT